MSVLSLGRRVVATEGSGPHRGTFAITAAPTATGGPLLRATLLSPDLFEAAVMRAVHKDLMKMIVVELKPARSRKRFLPVTCDRYRDGCRYRPKALKRDNFD